MHCAPLSMVGGAASKLGPACDGVGFDPFRSSCQKAAQGTNPSTDPCIKNLSLWYTPMHEPRTDQLERSSTVASLAPPAARLVSAPDRRGHGRERSRGESVDEAGPRGWPRCAPPSPPARRPPASIHRAAGPPPRALTARSRSIWLSWAGLDPWANRRRDVAGVWHLVPPQPCGPLAQRDALEPAEAGSAGSPAPRGGHGALAARDVAHDHKGAQVQGQRLFFIDESGFYPLPSVVRTDAPMGQTPILHEWWTRDHLSAISAISPEGKLYFQGQDRAINSADVVAFLEHLRREVPGRMVLIWDGAPIYRSQVIKEFLANGAARRIHLEPLPAYAPELNPGEGLWAHLKGVELRNVCCFSLPHLWAELRAAVKRVRRKPRMIQGCFQGAGL
jgi:transposase